MAKTKLRQKLDGQKWTSSFSILSRKVNNIANCPYSKDQQLGPPSKEMIKFIKKEYFFYRFNIHKKCNQNLMKIMCSLEVLNC